MKAGPRTPDDRLYQFGQFIADPVMGTLRSDGQLVELPFRSFEVLLVLLEYSGAVVEKDTILERVWRGSFIAENNLARHVSNLRKTLQSTPGQQPFIVTIQGRGYRFVAPVRELSRAEYDAASSERTADSVAATTDSPVVEESSQPIALQDVEVAAARPLATFWQSRSRTAVAAIAVIVLALLVFGYRYESGSTVVASVAEPLLQRVTFHGGLDSEPTWSPDGKSLAYSSDSSGNFDIWIQPATGGDARRLTTSDAHDWQPSWSPDGRLIAFRSERDGGGLYAAEADGRSERKLTTFGYQPQWSPRGNQLLFQGTVGWSEQTLHVLDIDGGRTKRVFTDFLEGFISVIGVAWHPDSRRVSIYGMRRTEGVGFWTAAIDGSSPPVRSEVAPEVSEEIGRAKLVFSGFTWSPSADALYLEGRSGDAVNVWRVRIDRDTLAWRSGPERVTVGAGLDTQVAVSRDGRRIAFTARTDRTQVLAFPFDSLTGRVLGEGKVVSLPGTDAVAPDLARQRLVYRVSRGSRSELWIRTLEGDRDSLLFTGPGEIFDPLWSADGTRLIFAREGSSLPLTKSRKERELEGGITVVSADGRHVRDVPASLRDSLIIRPSDWSSSGSYVLAGCRSLTTDAVAICQVAISGSSQTHESVRILASDPVNNLWQARYSPNGWWVSFNATNQISRRSTIGVIPAGGGPWTPVTDGRYWDDKPRWAPDGRTLYFVSNRSGFLNVWANRFDPDKGVAVGQPFRITAFTGPRLRIREAITELTWAIDANHLILPITESTGAIWVLE